MRKFVLALLVPFVFAGCAVVPTIPMESAEQSQLAKQFKPPPKGKAGIYLYRSPGLRGEEKSDVWIDGHCATALAQVF